MRRTPSVSAGASSSQSPPCNSSWPRGRPATTLTKASLGADNWVRAAELKTATAQNSFKQSLKLFCAVA
eukprot:11197676-Alexandrium_andersonii.AAC.1